MKTSCDLVKWAPSKHQFIARPPKSSDLAKAYKAFHIPSRKSVNPFEYVKWLGAARAAAKTFAIEGLVYEWKPTADDVSE